jgi:hypothetical protein
MTRTDILELDIDTRLSRLWSEAWLVEEWDIEKVAAFMRAAYGAGYCDALREPQRGQMCLDNNYPIPERKCA